MSSVGEDRPRFDAKRRRVPAHGRAWPPPQRSCHSTSRAPRRGDPDAARPGGRAPPRSAPGWSRRPARALERKGLFRGRLAVTRGRLDMGFESATARSCDVDPMSTSSMAATARLAASDGLESLGAEAHRRVVEGAGRGATSRFVTGGDHLAVARTVRRHAHLAACGCAPEDASGRSRSRPVAPQ